MSNIGSHEQRLVNFDWSFAAKELEYKDGDIINIGWYCSDRICRKGAADKVAFYYKDFGGAEKQYSFNDVRLASNTIGSFLRALGLVNEYRFCLFMDRVPELYFSFLGILKGNRTTLFSAFGDGHVCQTKCTDQAI
jgi:acetyl-CoA synthetase